MPSLKCVRCGNSEINTAVPPYGGYCCHSEHMQCAKCNEILKNRCYVCKEQTFFFKFLKHVKRSAEKGGEKQLIELFKINDVMNNYSNESTVIKTPIEQPRQMTTTSAASATTAGSPSQGHSGLDSSMKAKAQMDAHACSYGGVRTSGELPPQFQKNRRFCISIARKQMEKTFGRARGGGCTDNSAASASTSADTGTVIGSENSQSSSTRTVVDAVEYERFKEYTRAKRSAAKRSGDSSDDRVHSSELVFIERTKSVEQLGNLNQDTSAVHFSKQKVDNRKRGKSQPPPEVSSKKRFGKMVVLSPSEFEEYKHFSVHNSRLLLEQMQQQHNDRMRALSRVSDAAEQFMVEENKAHQLVSLNTEKLRKVFENIEQSAAGKHSKNVVKKDRTISVCENSEPIPESKGMQDRSRIRAGSQMGSPSKNQCHLVDLLAPAAQQKLQTPQADDAEVVQKTKRIEELRLIRQIIENQEKTEQFELMKMQRNETAVGKQNTNESNAQIGGDKLDVQMKNILKVLKEEQAAESLPQQMPAAAKLHSVKNVKVQTKPVDIATGRARSKSAKRQTTNNQTQNPQVPTSGGNSRINNKSRSTSPRRQMGNQIEQQQAGVGRSAVADARCATEESNPPFEELARQRANAVVRRPNCIDAATGPMPNVRRSVEEADFLPNPRLLRVTRRPGCVHNGNEAVANVNYVIQQVHPDNLPNQRIPTVARRAHCAPFIVDFNMLRAIREAPNSGRGDSPPAIEQPRPQSVPISVSGEEWHELSRDPRPEISTVMSVVVTRYPVACPEFSCNRTAFISDLNRHLIVDHHALTMERMRCREPKSFFWDPHVSRLNEPKCHMLYLVRHKVRDLGNDEYRHLLPVMVMSAKMSVLQICGYSGKEVDEIREKNPNDDLYIIWLTGIVPDNSNVVANISIWPINARSADNHTSRTVNVYSLRNRCDLKSVFRQDCAIILTNKAVKHLSNNGRQLVGVQVVVY